MSLYQELSLELLGRQIEHRRLGHFVVKAQARPVLRLQIFEAHRQKQALDVLQSQYVHFADHLSRPFVVQCPGAEYHIVIRGLAVGNGVHQRQQCAAGVQTQRRDIFAHGHRPGAYPVVQQFIEQLGPVAKMVVKAPAGDAERGRQLLHGDGGNTALHERGERRVEPVLAIQSGLGFGSGFHDHPLTIQVCMVIIQPCLQVKSGSGRSAPH